MSQTEPNHPSLFEELNRKAVDALVWLEEGEASGELTPDQAYAARQALFTALAGLLRHDVNDLLSASAVASAKPYQEVCMKNNTIAVLTLGSGGNVAVHRAPIDTLQMTVKNFPADGNGTGLLRRVRDRLYSLGFQPFS